MSDRGLVDIHVADVLYLPDNYGTTLAYRELQRGGMRIQHGTAQDAGSRLCLDSDTLGPYVPLDEEYTFNSLRGPLA